MNDVTLVELCNLLEEMALFAAESYRKATALEAMVKAGNLTKEAFRQAEGKTDADGRLATLTDSVAELRESLRLPRLVPLVLPERPE